MQAAWPSRLEPFAQRQHGPDEKSHVEIARRTSEKNGSFDKKSDSISTSDARCFAGSDQDQLPRPAEGKRGASWRVQFVTLSPASIPNSHEFGYDPLVGFLPRQKMLHGVAFQGWHVPVRHTWGDVRGYPRFTLPRADMFRPVGAMVATGFRVIP
jgi:hypothetical protein